MQSSGAVLHDERAWQEDHGGGDGEFWAGEQSTKGGAMSEGIDMGWTAFLWEVGAPIRDRAREIAWQVGEVERQLAKAVALHAEQMAQIEREAAKLEAQIAGLWSEAEIAAAKRGVMLVDGREVANAESAL